MASYQLPAGVHSFLTSEEGSVEYADSLNVISGQFEAGQLTVLDLVSLRSHLHAHHDPM